MNIYEAFKSGKPFKRPCWGNWVDPKSKFCDFQFTANDMLATDYFIEVEGKEFTFLQIKNAVIKVLEPSCSGAIYSQTVQDKLEKELGF